MITKLYVDNYKTLVDFTVEFQPLTLIVGANGSGKTAITEVLNAVSLMLRGKLELNKAFPRETLPKFKKDDFIQKFQFFVTLDQQDYEYIFSIEQNSSRSDARVKEESLTVNNKNLLSFYDGNLLLWRDNTDPEQVIFKTTDKVLSIVQASIISRSLFLEKFTNFFSKFIFVYQVNPLMIKGYSSEENDFLGRNGEHFSAWYKHNQSEQPLKLPELYSEVASFMPGFTHFRLSGAEGRRAIMCDFSNKTSIDFDYLSEGQKSLILLYSILIFSEGSNAPGQTLIFDEPDNFIALREIQPWLRMVESWVAAGKRQVILISHHPGVINFEGDEKVIWLVRENGGPTSLRTPTDLRETSLADQMVWDEE